MSKQKRVGTYVQGYSSIGGTYDAYIPRPLPPDPPVDLTGLYTLLDKSSTALGRLDGMSMVLPDASLFLDMCIRKEAVLSSQMEGTQSSLSDLLLFENSEHPSVPIDDAVEVARYISAMNYGIERSKHIPLSLRLIRGIHQKLTGKARGGAHQPGVFRSSQNWIGGAVPAVARFVPPPPERLMECLSALEQFFNDKTITMPPLIKAALVHAQFETIHPFLDGNGRLGRLLIILILCTEGVLQKPLLYLSLYFEANRKAYYSYLQAICETGDWESWIEFFLKGVMDTAKQGTETAQAIVKLFEDDRSLIGLSGKSTFATLTIHAYLQQHPISSTASIRSKTGLSQPTVIRNLSTLESLGIVSEITGKQRHKKFVYRDYLEMLESGLESL